VILWTLDLAERDAVLANEAAKKWQPGNLCSTDTDRRISIGPIRIRGYVKFLQNLKAQRCIGVSDTDTRIRIGYMIRGHVEVSGLQS